jgi:guanidinopropionase
VAAEGFNPFHSGMVPRYQEIATFMRAARATLEPPLDVALVGVPLDIGATYRVGARHGPAGVREASRLIRQVNPTTGVKPFELCNVGDAPTDPLDVVRSVALIQEFFERIHGVGAAPLAVGGDHTVPLGSDPDVGQRSAMPCAGESLARLVGDRCTRTAVWPPRPGRGGG